jgi:hypothetical protein
MKAQRRHELQQNVLDAELGRGVEFLRQRRTLIIWSVVLVVLAVLAVTYAVRSAQNKRRALQTSYDRLVSFPGVTPQEFLDGMKSLAESSDGHLAALATVQVGKYYAAQFSAAGGDAADARQRNLSDQAAAYFRRAIERFPRERLAMAEAHLGLGRLGEDTGDFATAAQEYQTVKDMADLAGTPPPLEAARALDQLERLKAPVPMATTRAALAAAKT